MADHHDGWLTIDKAVKGKNPRRPNSRDEEREGKRLPIGDDLAYWIEKCVDPEDRLTREPLFRNPRTGHHYAHKSL